VEDQVIGDGAPGPVWRALHEGLIDEQERHPDLRTRVF
jgi:hypothetical protein